jgi:hypothetical protein
MFDGWPVGPEDGKPSIRIYQEGQVLQQWFFKNTQHHINLTPYFSLKMGLSLYGMRLLLPCMKEEMEVGHTTVNSTMEPCSSSGNHCRTCFTNPIDLSPAMHSTSSTHSCMEGCLGQCLESLSSCMVVKSKQWKHM